MHTYITYVADRSATRDAETLIDFFGLGGLIKSGEITYESARDQMVTAFKERGMSGGTAKVYVSHGYALAQLFDKRSELEDYADDVCDGSRSMKRIYDSTKVKADKPAADAPVAEVVAEVAPTPLIDVILGNLAHLTDRGEIARVYEAAYAMLAEMEVAA